MPSRIVDNGNAAIPDGSSLNLQGAPGADAGGYAGFNDRVNNHYGRIFGGAILMSLLGAGAQLNQPQLGSRESSAPDASQIIAAQLGQQMSEAGRALVRKGPRHPAHAGDPAGLCIQGWW